MNNTVHYRHVRHTLALMCAKNHLLIFSSFLDIWENVEWPRFLDHPVFLFKKGTLFKRAGVRTPWTPPLGPPLMNSDQYSGHSQKLTDRSLVTLVWLSLSVGQVGNTSLHLAACRGFSRTLRQLIVYRADVHLTNTVTGSLTLHSIFLSSVKWLRIIRGTQLPTLKTDDDWVFSSPVLPKYPHGEKEIVN